MTETTNSVAARKGAFEAEFAAQYGKLNTEQKLAVDSIEGPVFVIAGPGTGKTQVLTLRIANILRTTDTPPEAVLALTFTESGAHEMRARLSRVIGTGLARRVHIQTFHGFAESVIARFPDSFPRIIGSQIATDIERAEMFDAVLMNAKVEHLRPFGDPLYYHFAVSRAISTMKRENVTPKVLRTRIEAEERAFDALPEKIHAKGKYEGKMKGEFLTLQKKIAKTRDLLAVYEGYENELTARKRYDFEDVILEVEKALERDEDLRLQVQEQILYVLADEHQDANRAQNALLEMVSGFFDTPNLFIVGDEKQAIYRFQGADLDNVHYFKTRFPETKVITLVQNYRSTQNVLDTALSLITSSPDERLSRVPLLSSYVGDVQKPVTVMECSGIEHEISTLVHNIQECLEAGTEASEIAILVRRNKDVATVAEMLGTFGMKTNSGGSSDGSGNAFHNRYVAALVRLLRYIAEPRDENALGVLTLNGFLLSPADVWRISHEARKEKQSIFSVLSSSEMLERAKVSDAEKALNLAGVLGDLSRKAGVERPAGVAAEALRASGILTSILNSHDREESLAAVRALMHTLEELVRREHGALLPRALELLDLHEERGIALSPRGDADTTRVQVMTVHRSKGREFERVFMPLLTESAWSTKSRPEHFHLPDILSGSVELEDERRLLYVGITRAKKGAVLSYSTARPDGRADLPSILIDDLNPAIIDRTHSEVPVIDLLTEQSNTPALDSTLDILNQEPGIDDLATLSAAFFAQGLSPTALNNFLQCPWKYFYVNLLRIPEAENKFMLFGTAIHIALKRYADTRVRGEFPEAADLIRIFERALDRSPLSTTDIAELTEKGNKALSAWVSERAGEWPERTRAEVPFQAEVAYAAAPGGTLLIRGALDRIDEIGGGHRVIDYKTGKPKSRNALMGETKDGDGNYYRQLTFYKLLLSKQDVPEKMVEGVIEFVEPDEKGTIRTEAFAITDTEVTELMQTIQTAAESITTLSFWNDTCEDFDSEKGCEWCNLRRNI
jgi:DNA helicase II / ATP-dependent DNA helicase PcrA